MDITKLVGNPDNLAFAYRLFGRQQLTNALVGVFGSRNKLASIAQKNNDSLDQLVDKRNKVVSSIVDFAEELANLDED